MKKIYIKIILEDENGELIGVRTSSSWEIAEMDLDSLKRWHEKEKSLRDMNEGWNKEKKKYAYVLVERL